MLRSRQLATMQQSHSCVMSIRTLRAIASAHLVPQEALPKSTCRAKGTGMKGHIPGSRMSDGYACNSQAGL